MTSFHDPLPDRLLGPLARPLCGRLPPMVCSLFSLALATGAFAAFVAEQRVAAGVLILAAALIDAGAALTPNRAALTPNTGGGEQQSTHSDRWAHGMQAIGGDSGPGGVVQSQLPVRPTPSIGGGPAREVSGWGPPGRALAFALDTLADRYGDTLILAGMAVWAARADAGPAPLAVGCAAAAGALGFGYGMVRTWASAGRGPAARLFGWLGRDLCLLLAVAGTLSGQTYPALLALALLLNLPVFVALARLPAYLGDAPAPPH